MTETRIWKTNWLYFLACVLAPLALLLVTVQRYWKLPELGDWDVTQLLQWPPVLPFQWPPDRTVLIPVAVLILAILWWKLGVRAIFRLCLRGAERDLERKGFQCANAFTGRDCAVLMDEENRKIALLFKWNPFHTYVFPAGRVTKVWVDEGQRGQGVMEGTRRVSFLFTVGKSRVRANTFSSSRRWKMDGDNVLTAISMADMMADLLESLRKGEE